MSRAGWAWGLWIICCVVAQPRVALGSPADATAAESVSPIAETLDGLRWGMTKDEVLRHLAQEIVARYKPLIRAAGGIVEEDRLYQRMRAEVRRMRDSFVVFDGTVTGWDVSQIGDEFRHGSREAMLVVDDDTTRNYYFFIANRLWKWIKVFNEDVLPGQTLDAFGGALEARFGLSVDREGQPVEGARHQRWFEWQDVDTRLRAVRLGGQLALSFEARRVLERLAVLRKGAVDRSRGRNDVLESVLLEGNAHDHQPDDPHAGVADEVVKHLKQRTR